MWVCHTKMTNATRGHIIHASYYKEHGAAGRPELAYKLAHNFSEPKFLY